MKTYDQLVAEAAEHIIELMPWDLEQKLDNNTPLLLIDVREPEEFNVMHIANAINIPRGILEAASEIGYDETNLELANARDKFVLVICRSGKRSCMAAYTLKQLGFEHAASLKTGLRGWNDYDQPLIDEQNQLVDADYAEEILRPQAS
ncbi:MAG: rhodanese-like domain-containing protein [Gammaproteobacteria bacterium]|nr:rhodanese-like domain-containing protein [Gammaproteobacteria bacterium]